MASEFKTLHRCLKCGVPFLTSKAYLKLSYCNTFCEQSDLGFSLEGFIVNDLAHAKREEAAA